jgi:hypothetical protein
MILKKNISTPPAWLTKRLEKVGQEIVNSWGEKNEMHKQLLKNYKQYMKENNIPSPKILEKIPYI